MNSFKALVVDNADDQFTIGTRFLSLEDLPAGELLIKVAYSSINYKDALACKPNGNIVKKYPHVPGIDLAGVVVTSQDDRFQEGDEVLVTGYELGVGHFGGFSEYARVPSGWAVKLPRSLSLKEAMILGTAGFTAALSVHALQEDGVSPEKGPILVTGASGGVGSVSVSILAKLGYEVVASSGKSDMKDYLHGLGAQRVISREELVPEKQRPLDKQEWAGAIDCVGGKSLSYILSSTKYAGSVAVSGLTGGVELATTVLPFILRGIRLIGIDSVFAAKEIRQAVWKRLASELKPPALESMYTEISLDEIPSAASHILNGKSRGRFLVKV